MDANSLACACGVLDLVDPEPKKSNLKLLLKCILRQFNQEGVKVMMMEVHLGTRNYTITFSESIKKENIKQ